MSNFLIEGKYSSGSWARMISRHDDRTQAARSLMQSLGGELHQLYWDAGSAAAYALADLPDAVTTEAIITALDGTGAFRSVEAHELLTEEQLRDALILAADASTVYRVPGRPAVGTWFGPRVRLPDQRGAHGRVVMSAVDLRLPPHRSASLATGTSQREMEG